MVNPTIYIMKVMKSFMGTIKYKYHTLHVQGNVVQKYRCIKYVSDKLNPTLYRKS